jgi:hypothetical protein
LSIRYKLFTLRDELRSLKIECGDSLEDKHYAYLQDSLNTIIAHLPRYDMATLGYAEHVYNNDPEFRRRVDERSHVLDDCGIPRARSIRSRNVRLAAKAILINSGMLCAPIYPFVLMDVGLSALKKRIKNFASLSEPDFAKVGPSDDLSMSVS